MNDRLLPKAELQHVQIIEISGSQAPQMKNSRNIMIENFMRADIPTPRSYNETGCHVRRCSERLQVPACGI